MCMLGETINNDLILLRVINETVDYLIIDDSYSEEHPGRI